MPFHLELSDITGLVGDTLTFVGGIVLALDVLSAVRNFEDEQLRIKTLKAFAGRVRLETEDRQRIESPEQIHVQTLLEAVHRAKVGVKLVVLGFSFLLITRLVEAFEKAHTARVLEALKATVEASK